MSQLQPTNAKRLEERQLKDTIKNIMKKRGYKYEDLADTLGVSVNTVKRFLNREDLTVRRLYSILDWLGLTLGQIDELIEHSRKNEYNEYTEEQELFLSENPHHHHILYELMDNLTPAEIQKKFNLSKRSIEKYLLDLDQLNFIELHAGNRVRLLNKGAIIFRLNGPLTKKQSALRTALVSSFYQESVKAGHSDPGVWNENVLNFLLRQETYSELKEELKQVIYKYVDISLIEKSVENRDNLIPVFLFAIVANRDARMKVFGLPPNID